MLCFIETWIVQKIFIEKKYVYGVWSDVIRHKIIYFKILKKKLILHSGFIQQIIEKILIFYFYYISHHRYLSNKNISTNETISRARGNNLIFFLFPRHWNNIFSSLNLLSHNYKAVFLNENRWEFSFVFRTKMATVCEDLEAGLCRIFH